MNLITVYQIVLGIFAACLVAWLIYTVYKLKHSQITCKRATRVFRRYAVARGWKVFSHVTLGEGAGAVVVDQVVVGSFGVIVACDLHQKGKIYGDLTAEEWIVANGEEGTETKVRIPSPYHRAELGTEQLRGMLAKAKIYSVPVEMMVVKTQNQFSYITGSTPYLFDLPTLKGHLGKSRFEKENNVNVDAVSALLHD